MTMYRQDRVGSWGVNGEPGRERRGGLSDRLLSGDMGETPSNRSAVPISTVITALEAIAPLTLAEPKFAGY